MHDGATDPTVIRHRTTGEWWLFYTQRRASVDEPGVAWVHGSRIGVARSPDGLRWRYAGTLDDLMDQADVVVDCTPKGIGAKNKERYAAAGVKAIFQGGEKHALTGHSFVAQVNYAEALDRQWTRVVSCMLASSSRREA